MARPSTALFALALAGAAAGCHGNRSELPPVHLFLQMDFQQRYDAQEVNPFFTERDCPKKAGEAEAPAHEGAHGGHKAEDPTACKGRAMRPPVPGTVAVGFLKDDDELYRGRGPDGRLIDRLPGSIKLSGDLLARGEERFNIYCQPCHDYTGGGRGVATLRGGGFSVQPANLNDPRLRAMPLGYFYDVISNGKGTMLPYAAQIPTADRWAISAWVRALQVARTPEEVK